MPQTHPIARVLFVDDEPRLLNGLRRALSPRRTEWDMEFISDPAAAIRAQRARPFDVVVTDIAMPGIGGLEMVAEMRKSAPEGIYIILTGTADLNVAVEAINKAAVFRFFTKPCAAKLIAEAIAAGLEETKRRPSAPRGDRSKPGDGDLTAALGLAALNRVPFGVIVVDRHAHAFMANRAGGVVLSEKDGLFLDTKRVCRTSHSAECERLHELIRIACDDSGEAETAPVLSVSRPSMTRPLTVLVSSLSVTTLDKPLAGLFIADQEKTNLPSAAAIETLFGLTPTQSRLVRALVQGANLEGAADTCDLTISSARTYLKQIFAKTGTSRQSELLKLVLTTPVVA